MTLIQSLILGIIQGLTEFLPISSSAHLVIIPHLLGWQIPQSQVFPFDVLVQLGTLTAVILYFWKDLWEIIKGFVKGLIDRQPFGRESARLGWYLILATIPAGVLGVLIKSKVEEAFNSITATAIFLFVTALFLVIAEIFGQRTRTLKDLTWLDAAIIGLFQAISLFPGVSRSGSTITGGMLRKLDRPSAARFSFLMSIPAMLGAGVVSLKDALEVPGFSDFLPMIVVGFLAALLVGYLAIHWFLGYLGKKSLYIFAIYCAILGIFILIWSGANPATRSQTTLISPTPVLQSTKSPASSSLSNVTSNLQENPLRIVYTSSLSWLEPVMNVCTESFPGLSIVTREVPATTIDSSPELIHLQWGDLGVSPHFAYEIGNEDLAIIVNGSNALTQVPIAFINDIFSGRVTTWGNLFTQCPDCFSSAPVAEFLSQPIHTFSYSSMEEPQSLFLRVIMGNQNSLSIPGVIVPDSLAMIAEIGKDPAGIGFAGSHSINNSVKRVAISDGTTGNLVIPILAILQGEPTSLISAWLACVQNVIKP